MSQLIEIFCRFCINKLLFRHDSPDPVQEAVDTHKAVCCPWLALRKRSHEHLVHSHRIGSIVLYEIIRIDNVLKALAHLRNYLRYLFSSLLFNELSWFYLFDFVHRYKALVLLLIGKACNHSLVYKFLERFLRGNQPQIVENIMPESGIEKVEYGVLCPSDIEAYRHPVLFFLRIYEPLAVVRIYKAEIVPAGACPLRHCISLPLCRTMALRALAVNP